MHAEIPECKHQQFYLLGLNQRVIMHLTLIVKRNKLIIHEMHQNIRKDPEHLHPILHRCHAWKLGNPIKGKLQTQNRC